MPRSARKASLETRTARARLPMRRAPYFVKIAKGLRLGYYRGSAAGTWIGRRYRGGGCYDTHRARPRGRPDRRRRHQGVRLLAGAGRCAAVGRKAAAYRRRHGPRADRTLLRTRSRTISTRSAPRRGLQPSVTRITSSTPRSCRNSDLSSLKSSPPTACCAGATASRPDPRGSARNGPPIGRPPGKSRTTMMPGASAKRPRTES